MKHLHSIVWSGDGIIGVCLCGGVFHRWRWPREHVTGGILQMWYSESFQKRLRDERGDRRRAAV